MPRRVIVVRRGRSQNVYAFARQVPAAPIQSEVPYVFVDTLAHQNRIMMHRENDDLVYRGDARPQDSCVANISVQKNNGQDQLTDTDSESLVPTEPTTPNRLSSPFEHFSSLLTPLPPARPYSPTVTELMFPMPARITTYSKRDRQRGSEAQQIATRKAQCSHQGYALEGVWNTEALLAMGHTVHEWDKKSLMPLIDKRGYVIAVFAGAPKDRAEWWVHIVRHVTSFMRRFYHNGHFDNLGVEEARVRFGIGFGELGAKPHQLAIHPKNVGFIAFVVNNGGFKAINAYHNHLYQQVAPKLYVRQADQVAQLTQALNLRTPFLDSVFTTTEISFSDVPNNLSRKNLDATFDGMEAITFGGEFTKSGIMFWEDDIMIPLEPGSTVIFPSGTKRYSFVALKPNETRYIFRQYCNSSAMRWLEKGQRSDTEFEERALMEEQEARETKRDRRPVASLKLYSKLNDIYVF